MADFRSVRCFEGSMEATIKQLIVERLQFQGLESTEITNDTPLFDGGLGLDSVDALELVLALEKEFGIKVENEQIDDQTLRSVAAIKDFVESAQGKQREADPSASSS